MQREPELMDAKWNRCIDRYIGRFDTRPWVFFQCFALQADDLIANGAFAKLD
jgi:hypothetical protein